MMMTRLVFLAALVVLATYAEARPKSAVGMLQMSKTGFMAKSALKKSVEAVESDRAAIRKTLQEVYNKNPQTEEEEALEGDDEPQDPDAVETAADEANDPADYSAHQFVVAQEENPSNGRGDADDSETEDDQDLGDSSEEDSGAEDGEDSFIQAGSKTKREKDAFYKKSAGWGNLMDSDGGEEYEFGQQTVAEQNDFSEKQYESNDPNDDENGYDGDYNTKETDHPDGEDEEESEAEQEEDEKEGDDEEGDDN